MSIPWRLPIQSTPCPLPQRTRKRSHHPPATTFFPSKLFEMLTDAESLDLSAAVSWRAEGRAFLIKDRELFMTRLYPRYFKATKYRSFQRQCGLWGFRR